MEMSSERHAPAALPSGKKPSTHFIQGWVGTRNGLERRENSRLHQDAIRGQSRINT